jgi:menaquinone-dependent protoporphyrinogen oxidase
MFRRRVLVLYGSVYGQTAKIARRIGERLTEAGHDVVLASANALPPGAAPGAFDGVILGSSIVVGRHQRAVRRFAQRHHGRLNVLPSAFFSVSASAAAHSIHGWKDVHRCLTEFRGETGWYPPLTEGIAGSITYTRYGRLLRWWMWRVTRKQGGPTDTSRDHELTDWTQVDRFADAFDRMLTHSTATHPAPLAAAV